MVPLDGPITTQSLEVQLDKFHNQKNSIDINNAKQYQNQDRGRPINQRIQRGQNKYDARTYIKNSNPQRINAQIVSQSMTQVTEENLNWQNDFGAKKSTNISIDDNYVQSNSDPPLITDPEHNNEKRNVYQN